MRSSSSGSHVLDLPSAGSNSSSCDEDLHEFSSQSDLDSLTFDSAEGPTQLEHTFARLQEAELMRNGFLSLTQRVELNRNILQHLLRSPPGLDQSESRVESNTGESVESNIKFSVEHNAMVFIILYKCRLISMDCFVFNKCGVCCLSYGIFECRFLSRDTVHYRTSILS